MNINESLEFYQAEVKKYQEDAKRTQQLFHLIGNIKLVLFICFAAAIFLWVREGQQLLGVAAACLIVIQISLWFYHSVIEGQITYFHKMEQINQANIDRIDGKWKLFQDQGEEFIDYNHPYGNDLDIVGKHSLFQFLNSTYTSFGRKHFAEDLLNCRYPKAQLIKRQQAIAELSEDQKEQSQYEYLFLNIGYDQKFTERIKLSEKKTNRLLIQSMPIISCFLIALNLALDNNIIYSLMLLALSIQILFWIAGIGKIKTILDPVAGLNHKLGGYSKIILKIHQKAYTSSGLLEIQEVLSESAIQAMKDLGKISNWMSVRGNALLYLVLNVLFLWDYQCVILMEEWVSRYSDVCDQWFEVLGEFESMLCFAKLPYLCEQVVLPTLSEQGEIFTAELAGHPLIDNQKRVYNDFNCGDAIYIITGSNMSGKTTFLRTVGLNLVLAQAGSFVCAKTLLFSPIRVFTCMRVQDDLAGGISTFYAELKRIKYLIDQAAAVPGALFLIDEMFRGTNSTDRMEGSKAIVEKLNQLGAIALITTHDLGLCDLENELKRVKNGYFREFYQDEELYFDYHLRYGRAETTNARYLMKMLGLID